MPSDSRVVLDSRTASRIPAVLGVASCAVCRTAYRVVHRAAYHAAYRAVPILVACFPVSVIAPLHAQEPAAPFPRAGLAEVNPWGPGGKLVLGSVAEGAAAISLTFTYDPTSRITLSRIGHRGTRPDGTIALFEYMTDPPAGQPTDLWKAVLRPLDSNTPVLLGPGSASGFSLWVDQAQVPRRAVFHWAGSEPGNGSPRSVFWFELQVEIPRTTPQRAVFATRMSRVADKKTTPAMTLDEVHVPIVHVRQPGSSQLARILVPAALNAPLPSTNLSMRTWQAFGLSATLQHPARGQQMQFSALYAGDPAEVPQGEEVMSAYHKVLYFSTEDTAGHFKFFRHDVVSAAGLAAYRWTPVYYPAHGPTGWNTDFASPYAAVICAIQARSPAYWYDVTSHYREFVRDRMHLTPVRAPVGSSRVDLQACKLEYSIVSPK